jgi:hypothetical protein
LDANQQIFGSLGVNQALQVSFGELIEGDTW